MMSMATANQSDWDVSPPARMDEAFALMRRLPMAAVAWWVVGAAPMVLGWLLFWTDRTRGGAGVMTGAGWAIVMTMLYVWLKVAQAFFARAVWARMLVDGGMKPMSGGEWWRRTAALVLVAAAAVPAQLLAMVLVFPIAWVFGFFHHATVVAYTCDLGTKPLRRMIRIAGGLAHHEPLAHHFSLLLLGVLSLMVWGAVYSMGLLLPYLLKILTGVESEFTRSPLAVAMHPLFFMVTAGVAWLVISPYVRVVYVGRSFDALSRRTGDDLMARLQAVRRTAAAGRRVLALLVVSAGLWAAPVAAEVPAPADRTSPASSTDARPLAEAIQSTLAGRDYQWRLPRDAGALAAEEEWAGVRWIKAAGKSIGDAFRRMDRFFSRVRQMVDDWFGGKSGRGVPDAGQDGVLSGDTLRGLLALSVGGLVIALLVTVAWMVGRRRRPTAAVATRPPTAAAVDLADEATLASALPEDEWLQLAKSQWAQGDLRMAVRAIFLATLASLGEQRLLDVARSKSNQDYLAEVRRRTVARVEVPEAFGRSIGVFEQVWYGLHDVAPTWIPELLENHQRMSTRVPVA